MKNFNELSKKELASLTEIQVDAYIDLELSNRGINKQITLNVNYPDYVKNIDVAPERDMTIYEVDDYYFPDIETANKFVSLLSQLTQLTTNYDWNIGSDNKYISGSKIEIPQIHIKKMYSEPKYLASKELLKQINEKSKKESKTQDEACDSVINYEAIDNVKYEIRKSVREALGFFYQAEKCASNYEKYFTITEDKNKALNIIYSVYNIQDEEMKKEILFMIDNPKEEKEAN